MTRTNEILFVLFLCMLGNDCESGLNQTMIVKKARQFCYGKDICSTNSTTQDVNSCCFQCSCDPSCNEYGNCCFPDQGYPIGNEEAGDDLGRRDLQNGTSLVFECLYPSSPQPTNTIDRIQSQSFWMVSEIVDTRQPSRNKKCGHIDVAPWGNLLPVSSKKTGHIYKNIHCANEHDVKGEDIVVWEGEYHCGTRRMLELSEAHLDMCPKKFNPPNDIDIQTSSFCFNSLTDTCSEKDFTVPMDLGMTRSEVIDACTSGFVSPYRPFDMFANIFCNICNGYNPATPDQCRSLFVARSAQSLSGLIDYDSLQTYSRDQLRRDPQKARMACLGRETRLGTVDGNCKSILCPFGQTRNDEGLCVYSAFKWSNIIFQICIQLSSSLPFNISQYFPNLTSSNIDISNIESPLPKSLKIEGIHYKKINDFTDTNELVIRMAKPTPTTKTKLFMDTVKKNINKKWLLKSYNATLSLNSKLFRNFIWKTPSYIIRNTTYLRIYLKSHSPAVVKPVFLTKLYFCENIQLESDEFNMSKNNIVFNKISNRYLYDNEYSLIKLGQNWVCRVCLSSSGYNAFENNNTARNFLSLKILISVICLFIIILMKANDIWL